MAIGSVSFGNTSFQDKINQPQAYQQQPSGATNINGEKKSNTGAKIGVGLAAVAIATIIGLGFAAKNGKFTQALENLKENQAFLKPILENAEKAGNWLCKKGGEIAEFAKAQFGKFAPKVQEAAEEGAGAVINA